MRNGCLPAMVGFLSDRRGNFAIIMSLTAMPMMGMVALAVDYSAFERQQTFVQASLDAAALAGSKELSHGTFGSAETPQEKTALDSYVRNFFDANLSRKVSPGDVALTTTITRLRDGEDKGLRLQLQAEFDYRTFLARIMGQSVMSARMTSGTKVGNTTIEVALVLDNSGSMLTNDKIGRLRSASKTMVGELYEAGGLSSVAEPVRISLVPFAGLVNIGTARAGASWVDSQGVAPFHNEFLNWNTYVQPGDVSGWALRTVDGRQVGTFKRGTATRTMSRFGLYQELGMSWHGCVESRPWPDMVLDTVAANGASDSALLPANITASSSAKAARLFVPSFAPSEPSRQYVYQSSGSLYTANDLTGYGWNTYLSDRGHADFRRPSSSAMTSVSVLHKDVDLSSLGLQYASGFVGSNQVRRADWIWRYQAAAIQDTWYMNSSRSSANSGPGFLCTTTPVQPLTATKSTITTALDGMIANGATNIHEGVMWGWRTLSSALPYDEGRPSSDQENRKVMIVLTDGENWYSDVSNDLGSAYSAYGYKAQGRLDQGLGSSDRPAAYASVSPSGASGSLKMDIHTLQACENARKDGVTIFTIAFDVADGSPSHKLLAACGGPGLSPLGKPLVAQGLFYYDVDSDKLDQAMFEIGEQIAELRLTR